MSARASLSASLMSLASLVAAVLVAAVAPSCADPVHDSQVASLPPEAAGIPQGEYHRAGQPCTWCHGPEGPAKTEFSLAGTIFWQGGVNGFTNSAVGVDQATVAVVDSNGQNAEFQTDCVGNFFVNASDFKWAFPILVAVYGPDGTNVKMVTQISRASSCAECHFDPPNYDTPGHIYLTASALTANQQSVQSQNANCPVDPNLGDQAGGGGLGP